MLAGEPIEARGVSRPLSSTDAFYQSHAADYAELTRGADMFATYAHFLPRLSPGARVLDAGCGAGRDLRAFVQLGFAAQGVDACVALCEAAHTYSGAPCAVARLEDLNFSHEFEGIWANASLLHLPRSLLPRALVGLRRALVSQGVLFASVQLGEGERVQADGRAYTYYSTAQFTEQLALAGLSLQEAWVGVDTLGRANPPRWLNTVCTLV